MLPGRYKKLFLLRIIIEEEKWTQDDNAKCQRSYVKPGQLETLSWKPNIHGIKVMLSICRVQQGVIYCELVKPGHFITGDIYRWQVIRLKKAIREKVQNMQPDSNSS